MYICVCVCTYVCVYMYVGLGALEGQKMLGALELELQAVLSCLMSAGNQNRVMC